MKFWKKPINIALSPNNTWKDSLMSLGEIVLPWNWWSWKTDSSGGRARVELEKRFGEWIGRPGNVKAVGSGREALFIILKALNLKEGDEIILQSFTCMVVVNAIVWAGLKPVFVDADDNYNLSVEKLKAAIGSKTRAVIVQHTFGIPAEVVAVKKICAENNLVLIEDCAHAMGAEIIDQKVGTIGDLSFFSLGRSKVISCVSGGLVVVNNSKYKLPIEKILATTGEMKSSLIFQNLLHPVIVSMAKYSYNFGIGKVIMLVAQKLHLLSFEVTKSEKKGVMVHPYPTRLPNALAKLALVQFDLLNKFNQQRRQAAKYYYEQLNHLPGFDLINPADHPGAIFLRYPLLCPNPTKFLKAAKAEGIILGDWYNSPVAPSDIDQIRSGYVAGSNVDTEKLCQRVINLPTYQNLNIKDWHRIIHLIKTHA